MLEPLITGLIFEGPSLVADLCDAIAEQRSRLPAVLATPSRPGAAVAG